MTKQKTALLVMVHGSPRESANLPMFDVVAKLKAQNLYDHVEVGFMECNQPSIPDAIDHCASHDVTVIIAVPYFLHVGTHVADDLPTLLEEGQKRHPIIQFKVGAYLGQSPYITEILAKRTMVTLA